MSASIFGIRQTSLLLLVLEGGAGREREKIWKRTRKEERGDRVGKEARDRRQ